MKYEPFKTDFDTDPQNQQDDPNQLFDLFAAPFRGVEGLMQGVYSLGDFVAFDALPDWDEQRLLGKSKTTAGGLVEGITQFVIPFGGIAKGLSYAGKASKLGKAGKLLKAGKAGGKVSDLNWKGYLAASTMTDAIAFDGQEARLSNLIQQFPQLQNPVTDFLAADDDDNEAFGRAKNVLEGLLLEAGIGTLAAPFVIGLKAIKKRRKALADGRSDDEALVDASSELGDGSGLVLNTEYHATGGKGDGLGVDKTTHEAALIRAEKIIKLVEDDPQIKTNFQHMGFTGTKETIASLVQHTPTETTTVGKHLDWLAENSVDPAYGDFINTLKNTLDNKTKSVEIGYDDMLPSSVGGRYEWIGTNKDRIRLRKDKPVAAWSVHEIIHAGTLKKLVKQTDDLKGGLDKIRKRLSGKNTSVNKAGLNLLDAFEVAKKELKNITFETSNGAKQFYGLEDFGEFIAEALSNRTFQEALGKIKTGKQPSLFNKVIEAVSRLIGLNKSDASLLNQVIENTSTVLKTEQRLEPAPVTFISRDREALPSIEEAQSIRESLADKKLIKKLRHDDDINPPRGNKRLLDTSPRNFYSNLDRWKKDNPEEWEGMLKDVPQDVIEKNHQGRTYSYVKDEGTGDVLESILDDIEVVKTAGGSQAIRQAATGKMTITHADGTKSQAYTIDGGVSTDELGQLLEASTQKLEGSKHGVTSEAQNAIMREEIADATGITKEGVNGIISQAGSDKTTLARISGRMRALRSYMVGNGLDIVELAKAYKSHVDVGKPDEQLAARLKSKFELQLNLQANVANLSSGFGRGLQSLQQKVGKIGLSTKEIENTKLRQEYLRKRGGVDVDKIVNDILLATDGKPSDIGTLIGLNKIVRGSEGGKWTNMVREYYINSLLWGPRTWSVNFFGNTITAGLLQFERYIGGWLSASPELRKGVTWLTSQMFGVGEAGRIALKVMKLQENLLDIGGASWKGEGDAAAGSITGRNILGNELAESKEGLATALDWVGDKARLPSRILMSTDELYKQILYRQRAGAQLWMQAVDRGLTKPEEIGAYVADSIEALVTSSGRHFSEASLLKDAEAASKEIDFEDHVARENFIQQHVEEATGKNMELAREKGLVDAEGDYGALQQLSEQWVEPNLNFAKVGTFTNELDEVSGAINKAIQKVPLSWLIIPFVKTPTNILKFAFDRTLAAPNAVREYITSKMPNVEAGRSEFLQQLNATKKDGSPDYLVRAEVRGKIATSVMLNGAIMTTIFANKDAITGGGPVNTRQKRIWEAAGYKPYSIRIPGGGWVSYQRLDPLATIIGIYADMAHTTDDSMHGYDTSAAERVVAALGITLARNVTNKSYLAGIQKFIETMDDPDKHFLSTARGLAANFVPNILYQGQSLGGDQELKEVRSLTDAFMKKLPGGADRLDPRRNILGEPYIAENIDTIPFNLLNPFNPISFSTKSNDPILMEMANLHHGFTPPSNMLNNLIDLTAFTGGDGHTAYDRWLELQSEVTVSGRTLRQSLERLIKTSKYQSIDPRSETGLQSPRVRLLQRIIGTYRQKALMQMLNEFPDVKAQNLQSKRARALRRSGSANQDTVLQLLQ